MVDGENWGRFIPSGVVPIGRFAKCTISRYERASRRGAGRSRAVQIYCIYYYLSLARSSTMRAQVTYGQEFGVQTCPTPAGSFARSSQRPGAICSSARLRGKAPEEGAEKSSQMRCFAGSISRIASERFRPPRSIPGRHVVEAADRGCRRDRRKEANRPRPTN